MPVRIQFRRGTATEWSSANPILALGELGYDTTNKLIKFGDGVTAWNTLPTAAAGDITSVTAGTGLSGGGTSGAVTLSVDNSVVVTASSITTKGDMLVGTGASTYTRLPVGTVDGSSLVVDSSQSTGVRWAAPASTSAVVPTGTILAYGGASAPTGFLICDGSAQSRTTYADLFNVITTTYGAGNGSSTFNIPDLRARVPVGVKSGDTDFSARGLTVGESRNTLTSAQVPSHAHGITFGTGPTEGTHSHLSVTTGNESTTHSHSVGVSGGSHSHDYNYIVGALGSTIFGNIGVVAATNVGGATNQTTANPSHTHDVSVGLNSTNHTHTFSINSTGNHSHNASVTDALSGSVTLMNLQPSLAVNYIIKT